MKKKVYSQDLKPGMYISELDRPWLDTSFLFQGILVQSEDDILEVQKHCEYVFVDPEKCIAHPSVELKKLQTQKLQNLALRKPPQSYPVKVSIENELPAAKKARKHARSFIDSIFSSTNEGRELDISQAKEIVSEMVDSIIRNPDAQMCLAQLKNRHEYTAQHSVNVCVLTITFGRHLGMDKKSLNMIGLGALLHDIGKLKIPLEILDKPGRLNIDEFGEMRKHPEYGMDVLRQFRGLPDEIKDVVFSHHERLGGHGYPRGLKEAEISPWSRIVAIVDVYDAITSDRSYHDGMKPTEALTHMYKWRSKDFDPELLEQFIQCIGIYPIGSIVELNNNEVGVVISLHPDIRLRPKLMLVLDEEKSPYYPARILDLAQVTVDEDHPLSINKVLEPGTYNIHPAEFIRELTNSQFKHSAGLN